MSPRYAAQRQALLDAQRLLNMLNSAMSIRGAAIVSALEDVLALCDFVLAAKNIQANEKTEVETFRTCVETRKHAAEVGPVH